MRSARHWPGALAFAVLLFSPPIIAEEGVLPDGARYEAPLRDGRLHGEGRLEWPGGDVYEGGFKDGRMSGQGELRLAGGDVYRGEFKDGQLNGAGVHEAANGDLYRGDFSDGLYHGQGKLTEPSGAVYQGRFEQGTLEGLGVYHHPDGTRYAGQFQRWQFHGLGIWQDDHTRYTGEFAEGTFHGYGERVDKASGQVLEAGRWRWGRFLGDPGDSRQRLARREQALYRQPQMLQDAIAQVTPSNPDRVELYPVLVAGDGEQSVFSLELERIRKILAERFGAGGRTLVLSNHPRDFDTAPWATATALERALAGVGDKMGAEDVLLLYFTSHGSEDHALSLVAPGHDFADLGAERLGQIVADLPVRWKVIGLSACYSGGFIPQLEAPTHLVMTAASADRTSFGCSDMDTMTYFGRALFVKALGESGSFSEAFGRASEQIGQWEADRDMTPSRPQMAAGAAIAGHLPALWRDQSSSGTE